MTIRSLISAAASARSLAPARALKSGDLFAPTKTQLVALAAMLSATKTPLVVVSASGRAAEETAEALRDLVEGLEIIEFPSWETLPHERLSPSPQVVGQRMRALHRLSEFSKEAPKHPVLLSLSIRAALQPVVGGLSEHPPLKIASGENYLLPELTLKLIEIAYERVDLGTRRGEFSIRGGILDVFPTTAEHAVRLEFFGDELEEIREFQVADQRSLQTKLSEIEIYPARELLITPQVASKAREMSSEFPQLTEMLDKISNAIQVGIPPK